MSPLVSIIIPAHNSEAYVRGAIDSSLNQTHPHVEVIVIDDASRDNTVDVLRSYGSKIRWEKVSHGGAPKARNRGLQLAHGEIVQFLDSDDLIAPDKIEIQVRRLVDTGATSSFCQGIAIEMSHPEREPVPYRGTADDDPVIAALGENPATGAGLHLKRSLLEIGGFREDLPCAQDRDLHLRLAVRSNLWCYVSQPLITSRKRSDSISSSTSRVLEQYRKFVPLVMEELRQTGKLSPPRQRAFSRFYASAARQCFRLGSRETASEYFRSAQQIDGNGIRDVFGPMLGFISTFFGPLTACRLASLAKAIRRSPSS